MQYYHWVFPALLQKMKPLCLDANHKEGVSSLDTYAELTPEGLGFILLG